MPTTSTEDCCDINNIPKYGPEELTMGALADRQVQLEEELRTLSSTLLHTSISNNASLQNDEVFSCTSPDVAA